MKSYVFVALQFFLFAWLVGLYEVHLECLPCLSFLAAGSVLGLWAIAVMRPGRFNIRPDVREDAELIRHLPYALIRHPMYSSLFLFSIGLLLSPYSHFKLLLWLTLCVVLALKADYEEHLLQEKFPHYADYQRQTWRFIPFVY